MMRPPPRSPLFPYTTLFRSSSSCARSEITAQLRAATSGPHLRSASTTPACARSDTPSGDMIAGRRAGGAAQVRAAGGRARSEENTSELQSLAYLLSRLLL